MTQTIDCVYLTCFRPDFRFLATVLQYSRIRLHRAESLDEADFLLTATGATVFLSDVTFPDGSWRDAVNMLREVHPLVAALIVADPIDWPHLSDAYTRGVCDVIWRPVDLTQAGKRIRVADQATRERQR